MDRMSSARPDGFSSEDVRRKKTSFTLDFASNASAHQSDTIAAKRAKQELLNEGILRSPDVSLLALATPDLERLIMQQAYGASPAVATTPPGAGAANPTVVTTPTQVLFPRSVTDEQEAYARGFFDALLELQRQQQQKATSSPHLQVVPDPRTGFLLPLTSPSDEGQTSLYTTLTTLPRGPQQLSEGTASKLSLQAMPLSVLRPGTLGLSDALSPVIRRSAIVPTLGVKPFPPFVNDSETLDLSPSGRFPTKTMENSVKRTMQAVMAVNNTSLLDVEQSGYDSVPRLVDALNELPAQEQIDECHATELIRMSSDTVEPTSSQLSNVPVLKEPPPFVNAGLPIQPIDMSIQELAKIERKREKNRYAAQKCRQLKLERIERLEKRIAELKQQNETLASASGGLRDHVNQLRQLVVQHVEGGCQIMTVQSLQAT